VRGAATGPNGTASPTEASTASLAASLRNRLQPVDRFTVAYLAIAGAVLSVGFPETKAVILVAAHLGGIAFLLVARRLGVHRVRAGDWLLAFYPLPLFCLLYSEIEYLVRLVHPHVLHDAAIQQVETFIFGGYPSSTLHLRLSSRILGEYLHAGYFSYYFLVPVLAFVLWGSRGRESYHQAMAAISLSFYVSFVLFVLYPVAGPYHVLEPPSPDAVGFIMPDVARWVVDRGSSIGAAFPSSHVAVAVTAWIMAIRYHVSLGILYAFLVPALAVGAVYGGFHYATDVLAGAVLGFVIGTLGHRLCVFLSDRR
jgi:hypothetical protein